MRLTRTVLLVALLVASLSISPQSAAFAATTGNLPLAEDAAPDTAEEPVEQVADPAPTAPAAGLEAGEQPADVSGGALPLLPDPETPAVARDVGVEELPLLVTEPPKKQDEVEIPAPVTGGGDSTLNPFSPLLLPQTAEPTPPPASPIAAPPAAASPAAASPTPAPTQPPAPSPPTAPAPAAPAAATPAPRPVAPVPPARAARPTLPRSLGASLRAPVSAISNPETGPLGRALGVQGADVQSAQVNDSGSPSTFAAVRAPSSLTPLGTAPTANAAGDGGCCSAQQVALGSGLSTLGLGSGNRTGDGNFTSLGGNRVSRALSSLQVHFTAMVTGTAIFRLGDDTTPVLLALGETLPGTELKLTNLTSRGAQFTEDDVRHTLFLTP